MKSYAVIDFETTGLSAGSDRIIEVAAVIVRDGIVVETFSELMNPGFRIPGFITSLTGISDAMVRGKPRPEVVMPRLRAFLGEHVCVAHNASFDQRFFSAEMELAEHVHERPFVCSLMLARRLIPTAPNHKLGTLIKHLRIAPPADMRAHRALADVLMTCALWKHLIHVLETRIGGRSADLDLIRATMKKPKGAVAAYLDKMVSSGAPAPSAVKSTATACRN